MTLTRGTGVVSHVFDDYAPVKDEITEHATACWCRRTTASPWPTRYGSCRSAGACS